MEGNRYGFFAVQIWVEQFWTNTDDRLGIDADDESTAFTLSYGLVMAVAAAFRHLVASFDNFVKSHRRAHSLTGTYVPQVGFPS